MTTRAITPTRRTLLKGASALGLAAALGPRAFAQDLSDPASLRRSGGTVLNMRAWERYPASDIPGLNAFLDKHPGLSIEWSSAPWARYRDRMIAEFIAQTPLDVVQVPETELAAWTDSEWLHPLEEFDGLDEIMAAATPAAREACTGLDGKVYSLPVFSDAFGLAYNTETLNQAGFDSPGKNLDELRERMVAIKKAGLDEFPLSLAMKKQPGQFWSLWATLYASGGNMFDENGEPAFDKPDSPMKDILEWYVAAINDWQIVGMDDLQRDWGTSRTQMRSGVVKAGYMAQYALTEFNVKPDSAVTGKIKMALVPGLETNDVGTVGYAHSAGMAAISENKDDAWTLLNAYAGPGDDGTWALTVARALDQGGRCPYPVVYEDPRLKELIAAITLGDSADYFKLSEVVRAKRGIKTTWYPEWEQFMMTQVQDALIKNQSVEAAITASAEEARKLGGA